MHTFMQRTRITPIALLVLLASLSAGYCQAQVNGDKAASAGPVQSQAAPSDTRVVAKVGDRQITLAELHRASGSALRGITDPAIITRIQAQVLQELINEHAAAMAFAADPVSQKTEVIEQLERLQRQVIMNYYLSIHASTIPNPDPQKIAAFLQKHPELVAGRQMFHFNQIVIHAVTESQREEVKALVEADPSQAKLHAWLKANRIPSEGNNFWRGTDQLNPAMVSILSALKNDGINVSLNANQKSMTVITRYDAYPDPASLDEARASITRNYEQDARNQAAKKALAQLRTPDFVQIMDPSLLAISSIDASEPHLAKGLFWTKALLVWIFALVVLVPAAVVVFYRQRVSPPREWDPLSEPMSPSEMAAIEKKDRLIRRLVVIPSLLPILYWLTLPMAGLIQQPPSSLTLQVIFILALAGLATGSAIVLACVKIPVLRLRMQSGWLGLAMLLVMQLLFFWFDVRL